MNQQYEKRLIKIYVNKEVERRNLRGSVERNIVLEELFNIEDNFSAEEFYLYIVNKNRQISMATIYNCLLFFEKIEIICKNDHRRGRTALYIKTFERVLDK